MRVISGTAKGKRLFSPRGRDIRPTSDRVKEAVFSIIGHRIINMNIIDVFAGTGSIGIEALSRGATHVFFIDSKREAKGLIQKNLEITHLADRGAILNMDSIKAIEFIAKKGVKAELIFLDPPYGISVSYLDAVIKNLALGVLEIDGLLILEHASKSEPKGFDDLEIVSTRVYGDTAVTIYEKKGPE